ncbi:MAG: tetratricopeptide repeat protein [Acidobacteria bacterium]|nr:tetratricopeptide repeat protein [Acidobacteriota bacterium]
MPPTHQHMLVLRDLRATVLADMGRFDEARDESRRAFELSLERFGDAHPRTVFSETNYGLLLANIGAFAEAEPILLSAIARWERLPPGSEVDAAVTRGALGAILVDLGRAEEARAILEPAREFLQEKLGPEHLAVAARSFHLARAYEQLGEIDEARRLHESTLAIREREQGEGLITADSLHEFGAFLMRRGELDAARERLDAALAMRKTLHRRPHVEIAETLAAQAELSMAMGREDDGVRLGEESAQVALEGRAPPHRRAGCEVTLARALHHRAARGDARRARSVLDEALVVLSGVFPETSP